MNSKFIHLHNHTEYSLLDGLSQIKDLINAVKNQGMDAVAITDHGVLYGVVEFHKKAKEEGIKPIIGMETYITGDITLKGDIKKEPNHHLTLLAKNQEGYHHLMELSSIAHLEGYYYRPRIDKKILGRYAKGLIALSGCLQGEVPFLLRSDRFEEAKKTAEWFLKTFGEDYYLEIQRHRFLDFVDLTDNPEIKRNVRNSAEEEKKANEGLIKLSRQLGIPLVATNDCHYINKEDAVAQDALICIATGKTVDDQKRLRYADTPCFYLKTPEEMTKLFSDLPDALENTVKIAQKCDLEIELGKWYFPQFPVPENLTAEEYLKKLCDQRLPERVKEVTDQVKERLEYELKIINQKGYAPYFLIVADMVNWANQEGIVTNTRGSAAGSLVSYVLGITTVNPLKYYLPFERFLNPYRPSPPDIDFDVADNRREEVINYIVGKYGREKVAQICTFGRMLSRAAIRDIARVLGYPYAVGDKIAKLVPFPQQGFPVTIPRALEESPELRELYQKDKDTKKIIDLAGQIEGNARHISVHAAGLVVAPSKLTEFSPVQREPSGEKIITQYEMHACEDVGLIKFDILGIRNLSILGAAVDILKQEGVKVDLSKIPLNDKKTFAMLSRGETMGVFQLGSSGMTKYLKELKPTCIEDLMAMVALYRPGPLAVIPEYIKRKRNPKLVKIIDKRVAKYLEASYGLIVYQDDLLFCAIELAGYTWEEADKFRKAVGKKIPEEMAAQKEKFIQGIVKNGRSVQFAEKIWKLFEPFQSYGFNKAHAASYGMVAYQTAYMKANFPVEYMTALLTAESGDKEKISAAVNECRRMKIKVLLPDINESDRNFTIVKNKDSFDGKAIRFGLGAIKNVGEAAINAILSERERGGKFLSFSDFLSRVDSRKVNKKVLESLIKVGATSSFGGRASLLANMDAIREKVAKAGKTSIQNQPGLFSGEEIKTASAGIKAKNEELNEDLSQEEIENFEKQFLGLSLSSRPITEIVSGLEKLATHQIDEIWDENLAVKEVTLAGVVREIRVIFTRKDLKEMAFVKLEDITGSVDLVIFPKIYETVKNFLIEGKPLVVKGTVDKRENSVSVIVNSVLNLSESRETTKPANENTVTIEIPAHTSAKQLVNLKSLLVEIPGKNQVFLIFPGKKEKLQIPFKIDWNEKTARQINEILSPTREN